MIKRLKILILILAQTTVVYYMTERIRGLAGRPFQPLNYLALGVFAACWTLIHLKRASGVTGYAKRLVMGGAAGRIPYLDWLRVLATVLVVSTHVLSYTASRFPVRTSAWEVLTVLSGLFLCCNLLFVMISGALALDTKEESVPVFYKKRLLRVLVPAFAYYLFYCFDAAGIACFYPSNWGTLLLDFVGNRRDLTPHFWLIYVILGCYLTAPFFRVMVKHMNRQMLDALAVVIFIIHICFTYLPYAGITVPFDTFMASWESVFLLGYFCSRDFSGRQYRMFSVCGILGLLAFVITVRTRDDYAALLYYNAPPMLFLSCAVFTWFRRLGETWMRKIPVWISVISRYSYSVLLIHWYIYFRVIDRRLGFDVTAFGVAGGTGLAVVLTLGLSLAAAFVFDNTVVLCLETLILRAVDIGKAVTGKTGHA